MVSSVERRRDSSHPTNGRVYMANASGACNVRVKRCSPMHFNRLVSSGEQNANNFFKKSHDGSILSEDAELLYIPESNVENDGQSTGSDTSNLLNTSSVLSSGNAESKPIEVARDINSDKLRDPTDEDFGSQSDNISCVSGLDNTTAFAEDPNVNAKRENGSSSATSVNQCPSIENTMNKISDLMDKSESSESPSLLTENLSKLDGESAKRADTYEANDKEPLEQFHGEEHPRTSQLANSNGDLASVEDDVRVCDICGDLGREDLLAVCSKCSDGAEHIYCMRIQMDKVPVGDWVCEDCEVQQDAESQNQCDLEKTEKTLKKSSSLNDATQMPGRLASLNSMKGSLGVERRKPSMLVGSHNNFSRSSVKNTGVVSMMKKRSLEAYAESPKASSPKKRMVKPLSPNGLLGNKVTSISKLRLMKSKSFHIEDSKMKDRLARQDNGQKPAMETRTKDCRKEGNEKMLYKSRSFNNERTDASISDTAKVKKLLSPGFFDVTGQTGAKQTKEPISSKKMSVFKSGLSSLIVNGKKTTSGGKVVGKPSPVSGRCDQDKPGAYGLQSSSPRVTSFVTQEGLISESPLRSALTMKAEFGPKANDLEANTPSGRHYLRKFPLVFSAPAISSQETVIPRVDCDWKGIFEVSIDGLAPTCPRIQAHRSTHASDKVLDVVKKFPKKMVLDVLPRLSTWPPQFKENHLIEDNIALFFFAEDLKSYENYKSMLKRMSDNDLALKGHIDGSELLIFSSSVLPLKSQRWNNMLFLWGVFRIRKVNHSEERPLSENRLDTPESCAVSLEQNPAFQPVQKDRYSVEVGQSKAEPFPSIAAPKQNDDTMRSHNAVPARGIEIFQPVASSSKPNLLPVQGITDPHQSINKSPVSSELFSGAGLHWNTSKSGYEAGAYASNSIDNEHRCYKRMKGSFTGMPVPSVQGPSFYVKDLTSNINTEATSTAMTPVSVNDRGSSDPGAVDLELSLGTVRSPKKRKSMSLSFGTPDNRDDRMSVSLSLSLGPPSQ